MSAADLSHDKCVLLAVHLASESNIGELQKLFALRPDAFQEELALRILLSYLPEALEPTSYTHILHDIAEQRGGSSLQDANLDISAVASLSDSKARSRRKHLTLPPLVHPSCLPSEDTLTRFLVCRAHRLADAGLLQLVPHLLQPYLDSHAFLRDWFISNVLPLLRFSCEYYPSETQGFTLDAVENWGGRKAVETWLSNSLAASEAQEEEDASSPLARDIRGLVGPWMYGYNQRKRRRLDIQSRNNSLAANAAQEFRRLSLDGSELHDSSHDWEYAFRWLAEHAAAQLVAVAEALEEWSGPADVDLAGFQEGPYLSKEHEELLHTRFVQCAYAAIYSAQTNTDDTISSAHGLLVRIATLMGFEPPPDLATSVDLLPKIDAEKSVLGDMPTSVLDPSVLLKPGHPLTNPALPTFSLLQMFVYSAYMLAELNYKIPIVKTAQIRFHMDGDEQSLVLQKIVHSLGTGNKRDEMQWNAIRDKLLWLWGWGIQDSSGGSTSGYGIFGKTDRKNLEKDILVLLLSAPCFPLLMNVYIENPDKSHGLTAEDVEHTIISTALNYYDNASNGNRNRGGLKKASDILSNLRKYFPNSSGFRRCEALFAATHSLSFYSLTLQHGVPFQPVSIRASLEPISLIEKVLSQNPRSYTHLDDLIAIGRNLVAAGLPEASSQEGPASNRPEPSDAQLKNDKQQAERRVIGMAIDAALAEDDFETAYSYVVNRLETTDHAPVKNHDDISWRAALAAGRHKSATAPSTYGASANLSTPPALRRLEQRMELLSTALLLAPPSALQEVLNVWRKCEEEMTALLARESAEETEFDDRADRGLPGAFVSSVAFVQPRREVGRGGNEEAPLGLFDVARGAAAAFSKSAFPLRGAAGGSAGASAGPGGERVQFGGSDAGSDGGDGGKERVRRRDMIAGAATGALASGIGWVLGATPVNQQHPRQG